MLNYEDAIKYKKGDIVTINFKPTGKTYRSGTEYHTSFKNLKCKIDNVDKHDADRPLRFEPIDPEINMYNRHYLPIEGVTIVNDFEIVDEYDMPEIEPGMWAKDRNGDNWLAVKTSKDSTKIEWIKAPIHAYDNSQYFLGNIEDLHDAENVFWDRNKQTKLKELQQKQQELTKELEALNHQIQALK